MAEPDFKSYKQALREKVFLLLPGKKDTISKEESAMQEWKENEELTILAVMYKWRMLCQSGRKMTK